MPPENLDFNRRAELTELMDEPCSREELRACLRDLERVNRWFLSYRPLLLWLDSLQLGTAEHPVHIVDVGCGYGDSLRRIENWAKERNIPVVLTGCDLNRHTISIAAEATPASSDIKWVTADVFSFRPRQPIDIVVSSLFTHHLREPEIVRFLAWMESEARIGWFINDLSRAAVPYHFFRAFAKIAGLHRFVQHDGPVSFARAFVPSDWRRMCIAAGLNGEVRIEAFKPARLCVARAKQVHQ